MTTKLGPWPRQCVLAYGEGCEPLARQIEQQWRAALPPLALHAQAASSLDGQLAELDAHQAWGLILSRSLDDPIALAVNKAMFKRGLKTLLLLDWPSGLWALRRTQPKIAPCLACLQGQPELLPMRRSAAQTAHSTSLTQQARTVLDFLSTEAATELGNWTLQPLHAQQPGGACLVLKDPLCPHCSAYARQPNQVYFHQESHHE